MVKDEMTEESALPESEQARRMIRRAVLRGRGGPGYGDQGNRAGIF